jgi:hypothetical protein
MTTFHDTQIERRMTRSSSNVYATKRLFNHVGHWNEPARRIVADSLAEFWICSEP